MLYESFETQTRDPRRERHFFFTLSITGYSPSDCTALSNLTPPARPPAVQRAQTIMISTTERTISHCMKFEMACGNKNKNMT